MIWLCMHVWLKPKFTHLRKRNQVHVSVWHIDTDNLLADIGHLQHLAKPYGYFLDSCHERLVALRVKVPDKFYLCFRNHQCVARGNRVNIEEHKRVLVFVYFVAGNFPANDFRKNTILHTPSVIQVVAVVPVRSGLAPAQFQRRLGATFGKGRYQISNLHTLFFSHSFKHPDNYVYFFFGTRIGSVIELAADFTQAGLAVLGYHYEGCQKDSFKRHDECQQAEREAIEHIFMPKHPGIGHNPQAKPDNVDVDKLHATGKRGNFIGQLVFKRFKLF